jgi:hypothetical protein
VPLLSFTSVRVVSENQLKTTQKCRLSSGVGDCPQHRLQRCRGGVSFLVPQREPASRRPQNSYRLLLNRSKILRLPILIIALLLRIDDLVEQLTRIFLGIFGGLLHRFGSFLKGFVRYIRSIAMSLLGIPQPQL